MTHMQYLLTVAEPTSHNIVSIILAIASVITALTVIAHFIKRSNDTVNERIRREAKEVALEEMQIVKDLNKKDIERVEQRVDDRFDILNNKIDELTTYIKTQGDKQDKMNYVMKQGHIETWKNDIRNIYYNLRDDGTISDIEKSYVDKVYHLYKEMGGNSDIDAKYAEMTSVYKKRLEESLDEAFEKNKSKKQDKSKS